MEEPDHGVAREVVAFGVIDVGRPGGYGIGNGDDEYLGADGRGAGIAGDQASDGGEVGARAVTGDGDAGGVESEFRAVAGDPADGIHGVVDGGGEAVFGREAVIDGEDGGSGSEGKAPAGGVMGVEIAKGPAAAVEVNEDGLRGFDGRAVEAGADGIERQVADAEEGQRFGVGEVPEFGGGAGIRDGHGGQACGRIERLEEGGGLGVEGHLLILNNYCLRVWFTVRLESVGVQGRRDRWGLTS